MSDTARNALVDDLRRLHVPGDPLVAPNAWDAASAAAIARAGFPAVSTSSAAISAGLGWDDGEAAPVEEMLGAAGRIAAAVDLPVTVDFERGYGLGPDDIVGRLSATGAAGLNLEDSDPATGTMIDPDEQADLIRRLRRAADASGRDLVINARTDAFLRQHGDAAEQLASSIRRGNAYLAAGADCVYPLGARGSDVIKALTTQIDGPVNIASGPQAAYSIGDLAGMGVARVTFGPGLQRHLYSLLESQLLPELRR